MLCIKKLFQLRTLYTEELVTEWEMSSHFSPWLQRNCKTVPECRLCWSNSWTKMTNRVYIQGLNWWTESTFNDYFAIYLYSETKMTTHFLFRGLKWLISVRYKYICNITKTMEQVSRWAIVIQVSFIDKWHVWRKCGIYTSLDDRCGMLYLERDREECYGEIK